MGIAAEDFKCGVLETEFMIRNCSLIKSSRRNLVEVAAASIAGLEKASSTAQLVAEASTDCDASASLRTAAAEHCGSALGLHAGPKAVGLDPLAAVGLECTLGHGNAPESLCENLCLNGKF